MADMDLIFPSWTQHERIAQALETIALNGATSAAALDAAVQGTVNGKNTTRLFYAFLPRAMQLGETSRYNIISRFADAVAQAWNDKTYTLRSYNASTSGQTDMTPLDDLAKMPGAAQLCTDTTTPVEDWADEDPMAWYIRANALSLHDGTMNITAFEGETGFDITGSSAPVYTFALALWIKEYTDGTYNYISFRTTRGSGFYPDEGDVDPNNKKRSVTWHPTFPGGITSSGALTSGAGIKPYIFASANDGIVSARKMTAYEGLWTDCDTRYLLRMWQLRHWNLENTGMAGGCISYNLQYQVALAESGVKRVLVSTSQGANFVVGSTVSIGDMGSNSNKDRGRGYMRNIADLVKISSIDTVTINDQQYSAISLEIDGTITTTATTYISTMPYHSGFTERLPDHKDGCPHSLTDGKCPLRVAGIEVIDGAYTIGLDPIYQVTNNATSGFDFNVYEVKDSEKQTGSVTSDYIDTGISFTGMPQGWNYVKEFYMTKKGVLFPSKIGGSSNTYMKSAFGVWGSGVRVPWRFSDLRDGAACGLACGVGNGSPAASGWDGRPRLSGAGKKRGEWTA